MDTVMEPEMDLDTDRPRGTPRSAGGSAPPRRAAHLTDDDVASYAEDRAMLIRWIQGHLKEGVDYGAARGGGGSKPTLLKPGAEKICLVFGWQPVFAMDADTAAMAGNEPGFFAFRCQLVSLTGQVVGEGRGGCGTKERSNMTLNTAIKLAEKRAMVDAVLRAVALSDLFTQDLEDTAGLSGDEGHEAPAGRVFGRGESDPDPGLRAEIRAIQRERGYTDTQIARALSGKTLEQLTTDELVAVRDRMRAAPPPARG